VLTHPNENAVNHDTRSDASEPMHQWMHQIQESGTREAAESLAELLIEALGSDGVRSLAHALLQRAEVVADAHNDRA
jgi:hypothetical protein